MGRELPTQPSDWALSSVGHDEYGAGIRPACPQRPGSLGLFAWSTDGKTVFFNQRRQGSLPPLADESELEDLSQDPKRLNYVTPIEDVSISPDGLWLVLDGMDGEGNRDIYFMTMAGSGRTRLTNDPKIDFDSAWRPLLNQ